MSLVEAPQFAVGIPGTPLYDAEGVNQDAQLNKPVVFKWHFPPGTFDRRMSALEIAEFILPHMPSIIPLLSAYPRAQRQFMAMLLKLATPEILAKLFDTTIEKGTERYDLIQHERRKVLDQVLPWIRRVEKKEEDEILLLCIGARKVPSGPIFNTFRQA